MSDTVKGMLRRNFGRAAIGQGLAAFALIAGLTGCAGTLPAPEHHHEPPAGKAIVHSHQMTPAPPSNTVQAPPATRERIAPDGTKIVRYDLTLEEKTVNFSGKPVKGLTVNGTIPGPVIEAMEGDTLEIKICNKTGEETNFHWHGLLVPPEQDGVPYLNTPPIIEHSCYTHRIPLREGQWGDYWWHAHAHMQEQRGVYGALIIHPRDGEKTYSDIDVPLVLSDWTDESPKQVMKSLRRDEHFYNLQNGTLQSWDKVIMAGGPAISNRLYNSFIKRMAPMDVADVGYDAFLSNGKKVETISGISHGDKVRLRLVNAGASSFFHVQFACGPLTVVASDGIDVKPFRVNHLTVGTAETYDIIVAMPHDGRACELRSTSVDGAGYASTILGDNKDIVRAPDMPRPNLLVADHAAHAGGHGDHAGHSAPGNHAGMEHDMAGHDMKGHAGHTPAADAELPVHEKMDGYDLACPAEDPSLDSTKEWQEIELKMTGMMLGYLWSFDDKMLSESDLIGLTKGKNVRVKITNDSMMTHTYHMHGHYFNVVNKKNPRCSAKKNTIIIRPGETYVTEFYAGESGSWTAHCHIMYHMAAGMARIFNYNGTPKNPHMNHAKNHDQMRLAFGDVVLQSNKMAASAVFNKGRDYIFLNYDGNTEGHYDIDAHYERLINENTRLFVGGDFDNEPGNHESRNRAVAGFHYRLPGLTWMEGRVDHTGHVRLEFSNEIDLTERVSLHGRWNTDNEIRAGLEFALDKKHKYKLRIGYDSDFKWGVGLRFTF
jgi:FtsP/CotA-like multicopper oxidase with cupredoxin domain